MIEVINYNFETSDNCVCVSNDRQTTGFKIINLPVVYKELLEIRETSKHLYPEDIGVWRQKQNKRPNTSSTLECFTKQEKQQKANQN